MSQIALDFDKRDDEQLREVLESLLPCPGKPNGWSSRNFQEPQLIGEYISALSNSATLARERQGWLVWGIADQTHEVVGTSFNPKATKGKGNEDLEPWLARLLDPRVSFTFHSFIHGENRS
jgi:predicted HTH transcriptional regulator